MGASSAQIFGIIMNVVILLVFFRFLMQLASVSPYNPVVVSTVKATKIVDIFGNILPTVSKGKVNLSALVIVILLYFLRDLGVLYLEQAHVTANSYFYLRTLKSMLLSLFLTLKILIGAYIVSSWLILLMQVRSPYIDIIQELVEPMLVPFRKIMPNMGMIDLSPIVAFFAILLAENMLKLIV